MSDSRTGKLKMMYYNCTTMADQNDATDLPAVQSVEYGSARSTAYFENGAKLRYCQQDGEIVEQVFAPSDPDSVMEEATVVAHPESTQNVLAESLDYYDQYETVEELEWDWETLADWICHA